MTASWHVVAKLLAVSRMSKVDYQNKVLPKNFLNIDVFALKSNLYLVTKVNTPSSEFLHQCVL